MPLICKDCPKSASFGYTKAEYCKTHKKDFMVDVIHKKCKEQGCDKNARGKTYFCKKHGGGKRCIENGCKSSAVDTFDFCKKHGGGERCKADGCITSAEGKTDFCKKHGGGKRCKADGCKSSSRSKDDYCSSHGGGKRCKEDGCNNSAENKKGYCISHGGGDRCPNCIDWIDSRSGDRKYDGYCATCFKVLFPDDERSKVIYRHTKEIRVRNEINSNFEGFIHDRPLYTGNCDCTNRRRIDHRKLIGNTILAIETDEFAHSGYDPLDEEIRYDDLYMIHSGKWIFIRFNPDGGKVDLEDKLQVLVEVIKQQIRRIENEENEGLLEIIKLYYNE